MSIKTKSQLQQTIRDAETAASLLRSPGFKLDDVRDEPLELRIANLLEDLANIGRRAFGEAAVHRMKR